MQTLENCELVLENDNQIKGRIKRNFMSGMTEIVDEMWWYREGKQLTDTDVNYLLLYLGKQYGLRNRKDLENAIDVVGWRNGYHPLRDYLNNLQWDGTERIRHVLHHFFGAEESDYTYEAMKLFLLGAITRVFVPGAKFEYMLCIVGGQGVGKSTFFRFLASRDEWFTDDLKKLDDENVYRKMQGYWIVEMSEMIATANARSIEDIKSFISRQKDTYKVPYEKYPAPRPRQCVFAGTSNNMSMLPLDRSGNRRFLPVLATAEDAECFILDNEMESRVYIDQLWAEAMEIYRRGEYKLALSKAVEEKLSEYQQEFMPEDTLAGQIECFLENYKGKTVCSRLLWFEALGRTNEPKRYELLELTSIMNNSIMDWVRCDPIVYPIYGKQRSWERKQEQVFPDKEATDFISVTEQMEIPFLENNQ